MANNTLAFALNALGILASLHEQIMPWLQVASLLVGIVAGLLAIYSTFQKLTRRKDSDD